MRSTWWKSQETLAYRKHLTYKLEAANWIPNPTCLVHLFLMQTLHNYIVQKETVLQLSRATHLLKKRDPFLHYNMISGGRSTHWIRSPLNSRTSDSRSREGEKRTLDWMEVTGVAWPQQLNQARMYTVTWMNFSISSVFSMSFPIIGVIKNNRCFPWALSETTPYTVRITNVKNSL